MTRRWMPALVALALLQACDTEPGTVSPSFDGAGLLSSAVPLLPSATARLEGIYVFTLGTGQFGDTAVVLSDRDTVSIFTPADGCFMNLGAGRTDTSVVLEGRWRYALNQKNGLVRFVISRTRGAAYVLGGSPERDTLELAGQFGSESAPPAVPVSLRFVRAFSGTVMQRPFWILAHRGGGINAVSPGASENSIELIGRAHLRGANGVEVDVRLSRDGVPFLYHDPDINLRCTKEGLLWGTIEAYTWPQLRTLVRLVNGEQIPSLDEALDFVVRQTRLRLVWLDMKSDRNAVPAVAALQEKYLALAGQLGRTVEILMGVPTDTDEQNLLQFEAGRTLPALCELNLDQVRRIDARVWAPRWTLGPVSAETSAMHAEGRRVFTWTLDDPSYIRDFLHVGDFDGILSDYPSLVTYYHYLQ